MLWASPFEVVRGVIAMLDLYSLCVLFGVNPAVNNILEDFLKNSQEALWQMVHPAGRSVILGYLKTTPVKPT
jgi:hypothetical protein